MTTPTHVGVDIGGSSVKAASGTATARSDEYTNPDAATLRQAVADALAQLNAPAPTHIGLCLPGIVADGRIEHAANLPRLRGVDVRTLLPCDAALRIDTDVRAAAHHIWHERRMPGRLLALALGTGVGACVLDDGEPLRVTGASSGHIGAIDVGGATLESLIGADALRRAGLNLDAKQLPLPPTQRDALLSALRTAHAIYRPNHIALLGGVGIRLDADHLRTQLDNVPLARDGWTLTRGWTTYHAAHGAALLAATPLAPSSCTSAPPPPPS